MQRFITTVAVALGVTAFIFSIGLVVPSCGRKGWNEMQRKEARQMLHQWRDMVYLRNMDEMEFATFADEVTDILEEQYPSYVEFIEMPMVGDSVEVVVVATIVKDIKANAHNMRYLFPYPTLVSAGVLPEGLTPHQQKEYYMCLANSVDNVFGSVQSFVWGAINSSLDDMAIAYMLRDCAVPFWE